MYRLVVVRVPKVSKIVENAPFPLLQDRSAERSGARVWSLELWETDSGPRARRRRDVFLL